MGSGLSTPTTPRHSPPSDRRQSRSEATPTKPAIVSRQPTVALRDAPVNAAATPPISAVGSSGTSSADKESTGSLHSQPNKGHHNALLMLENTHQHQNQKTRKATASQPPPSKPAVTTYIDPTPPDVAAARCASLFRLYSDPDTELLNMADFIDVCCWWCLFLLFLCCCVLLASIPVLTLTLGAEPGWHGSVAGSSAQVSDYARQARSQRHAGCGGVHREHTAVC